MAIVPNGIETYNRLSRVHERYRQIDDRQTGGQTDDDIANVNVSSSLKTTTAYLLCMYTVGHKKHTKMCFAITFVKLDGF